MDFLMFLQLKIMPVDIGRRLIIFVRFTTYTYVEEKIVKIKGILITNGQLIYELFQQLNN